MSLALLKENESLRAQLADAEARALRFGRQVGELRLATGEEAGKVMAEIAVSNRLRAQLAEAERQLDHALHQAIEEEAQHRKWTDDRDLLAKDLAEARVESEKLMAERTAHWENFCERSGDFRKWREAVATIHRFEENIVALLYVLMRDHLPTGAAEELILRSAAVDRVGVRTVYSAKHLEAYARELAQQLRDGKPKAAS